MDYMFDPTIPMLRGQQLWQGMTQAQLEGQQLREKEALRRAARQMGSQNYFAGYEGIHGAERPDYLKELYAEGDPDAALKLEGVLSEPFKIQRGVQTAGQTEEAKKLADYRAVVNAFPSFFGQGSPGVLNAFAKEPISSETSSSPAVGEPQASPAGMPPQPLSNLSDLSGTTKKMKIGPMGPEISAEQLSPFDRGNQLEQRRLDRDKYVLSGQAEQRAALQQAHDNVQKVDLEITGVQKAMQTRDIPWNEGQQKIQELKQERQDLTRRRDALAAGKPTPVQVSETMPTAAPSAMPVSAGVQPSPTIQPTAPVLRGTAPAPKAPMASAEPQFTEKERGAMAVKDREEKITAANKEIVNARLGVEKVTKFLPTIKELHKIVTTQNIGHPELEAVPGAGSLMSLDRSNAQVKKLNEAIINMFAEPGQSQMMNTIVERQMQGAVVPGLFTEPQLNKINSTVLMSNVEHLRNFPTFLEKWQKAHHGELTGAADAWIDYTDHNPRYGYKKDARGNVSVFENKHVIAPETWQYLRDNKMVRSIGENTFIKQKDGSWVQK